MMLTQESLNQFTGTEVYHRSPFINFNYTDGVKYLADEGQAYWLIELINHAQILKKVRKEDFQLWRLQTQDRQGKLTCEDGNGNEVYSREISYTDFPLPEVQLYLTDNVLLLPSEY